MKHLLSKVLHPFQQLLHFLLRHPRGADVVARHLREGAVVGIFSKYLKDTYRLQTGMPKFCIERLQLNLHILYFPFEPIDFITHFLQREDECFLHRHVFQTVVFRIINSLFPSLQAFL